MNGALRTILASSLLAGVIAHATPAGAGALSFGPNLAAAGWTAASFPLIPAARFAARDDATLEVATDASAGILWRPLRDAQRDARSARWRWRADMAVRATDLTRRGGDDRVLSIFFVFGAPGDTAANVLDLLKRPTVTALAYVFGGNAARGTVLASPHMGARGRFIVLRPADATRAIWLDERVDLAIDYARAFGRAPSSLLAVAISSDSDDTAGRNRALVADLNIGE
jgi:hypothetical protein